MTSSWPILHYSLDAIEGGVALKPLRAGDCLDRYRLEALVARSGMASIFRATDLRTGAQVAIKVPHPEAECDVAFFQRFQREVRICREIDHPGALKAMNEESPSRLYMVMEWVEGRLLRDVLAQEAPLPPDRATRIALAICGALDHIHACGVVHRDLKPENVMIDAGDRVKVIDFGIAAKVGARRLTFGKLSNIMGTPEYISPEQVKGKRGDARSDVYALGVMLYEMLTGETPFHGPNPFAIMNARLKTAPLSPRSLVPDIPPQFDAILSTALARNPDARYPSARQFAYDLEHRDQIRAPKRAAGGGGQSRWKALPKKLLFHGAMVSIPVAVFGLILYLTRGV